MYAILSVNLNAMIERISRRLLLLGLISALGLPLCLAQPAAAPSVAEKPEVGATAEPASRYHVTPGPSDGRIAFVTARLLEQLHYSRQPFDHSVSAKFLDRYLEGLDPQHLHFIQADLAEFAHYRTNLDDLTVTRQGKGDTTPACEIFNRFLLRLDQRVAYADELLKKEKFTFDSDERIALNRHELAYPKDLDEAKSLWRERLRFEYLQERLAKIDAKKKPQTAGAKPAANGAEKKAGAKTKTEAEEIISTLAHRYHRNLRMFADWNNDDVLQVYLTTLARVYDPHSDYFGHAQLESFKISMNLALSGIGAELISDDGYCTIRRLVPGFPADKSKKLKEKDRIVAVAQSNQPPVDVVDMNLNKVVQMIRGPKGTEVRLTVEPAEGTASTVVALTRDEIKLEDQAAKAKIIELPASGGGDLRLGVIDLPSFYAPFDVGGPRRVELASQASRSAGPEPGKYTSVDVAQLLKKLKQEKVQGVILDLRRNGGGSLEEAIRLTGLFIKEGPVVQVRNFDGTVQEDRDNDPSVVYDGPLIVLTSRFSASASEIVAGALQDYGRALVVGDSSTHGKGTVQQVNDLNPYMGERPTGLEPGALKVTIKKFYRASGVSTQLKGVVPDIILPSVLNESKDIGESSLENPLQGDTIKSAKYEHMNLVAPFLPELMERSTRRVATDQEFGYIREDIEQYQKAQADKTISLNEKQRLKEKEEADARQKARDKERLAHKEPQEKVYELTLKQVDLPGLPPPVVKTNSTLVKLSNPSAGSPLLTTNSPRWPPARRPLTSMTVRTKKASAPDVSLVEAEHILVDYLLVLQKENVATAGHRPE